MYAAQLAWPASQPFPDETTAFVCAAGRTWAPPAFMGVNLAALVRYYVRERQKRLRNLLPPVLGFAVCLLPWLNLSRTAQIAGGAWMAAGIAYGAWKTRGFRGELVDFEIPAGGEA